MKKIIIVSGFSGVGKGTIIERFMEFEKTVSENSKLWLSVSDTTRAPRNDGRDNYHYISVAEYQQNITNGVYLEHNEYGKNGYGTRRDSVSAALDLGTTVVLEIDYNGMLQVLDYFRNSDVSIKTVFFFADPKDLFARLSKRGDALPQIKRRLSIACLEANHVCEYAYAIKNNVLDESVYKLHMILTDTPDLVIDKFDCNGFCDEMQKILNSLSEE